MLKPFKKHEFDKQFKDFLYKESLFGIMKLSTFFSEKEFSDEYHNTFL